MEKGTPEKVLFKTRKRFDLQFDANPNLDQWIHSEVKHDEKTGEYVKHTGEALNRAEQATYKQYRRRHMARCRLGDAADKLSRITDKYMPRIADEGRVFIMKFPKQAPQLLKRVRKIRRKVEAKQKGDRNDISEGPSETADRRQRGTKATSGTPPHKGERLKGLQACDKGGHSTCASTAAEEKQDRGTTPAGGESRRRRRGECP